MTQATHSSYAVSWKWCVDLSEFKILNGIFPYFDKPESTYYVKPKSVPQAHTCRCAPTAHLPNLPHLKRKISSVKLQQLILRIWGVDYLCLIRQTVYCEPIAGLSSLFSIRILSNHFPWQCIFRNNVKIHTISWKEPSKPISSPRTQIKQTSQLLQAVCAHILDILIPG